MSDVTARLEYLRGEIRAERISQGELIELASLADQIDPGDVELLQWAGVPEFPEDEDEDLTETTVTERPRCDVHSMQFNETVAAMYDGKTVHGPWAYMCQPCFDALGVGLGLGKGQRLIVRDEP